MRAFAAACLALAAALVLVSSTAAGELSGPRPKSCKPPGSKALAKSPEARVFRTRGGGWYPVWGCLYSTGHAYLLGADARDGAYPDYEEVDHVRLAGPFVAYSNAYTSHYGGHELWIYSRDLRTKRTLHFWARGAPPSSQKPRHHVTELLVNERGSIGWVARRESADGTIHVVYRSDVSRGATVLDSGPGVEPGLELRDGLLVWRRAGEERSAPLG